MDTNDHLLDLLIQSWEDGESPSACVNSGILESLISNDSIDLRIWLARSLANHDAESSAVSLLHKLSQDSEACVRVEAVDSLCNFACSESFEILCGVSRDEDELVRAYSAFGIAITGKSVNPEKALRILLDFSEIEDSYRVLVDIYTGLYLLGKKETLAKIVSLFDSTDYHVQCAVLRALKEIINSENKDIIKRFINSLDTTNCPRAVTDAMQQLSESLQ